MFQGLFEIVFFLKKNKKLFFLYKINFFYIFKLFWYINVKNNFFKIKK
jgi:hypothetical protein